MENVVNDLQNARVKGEFVFVTVHRNLNTSK